MSARIINLLLLVLFIFCATQPTGAQRGNGGGGNGNGNNNQQMAPDPSLCTTERRRDEIPTLSREFERRINQDPRLIAGFVRAAFHDCITATANIPNSGCNGSLRLRAELNNNNNRRLRSPVQTIEDVVGSYCMSVADGIQLAMATALRMERTNGPDVVAEVVDPANPRVDANTPDRVNGQLPNRNHRFSQLLAFYSRKGFRKTDLVSSCAGGHSFGGFTRARGGGGVRNFTPDRNQMSSSYARNLFRRSSTRNNGRGFNTLNSDEALITDRVALNLLQRYSSNAAGLRRLKRHFRLFLIRVSRLNGRTVGDRAALSAGL